MVKEKSLTFKELISKITNYSGVDHASYFSNALAGEVGELCNIVKKYERGGTNANKWIKAKSLIGDELADVFIYTILNFRYWEINPEKAILRKLEAIKIRLETIKENNDFETSNDKVRRLTDIIKRASELCKSNSAYTGPVKKILDEVHE